jgi:hypothetical protein
MNRPVQFYRESHRHLRCAASANLEQGQSEVEVAVEEVHVVKTAQREGAGGRSRLNAERRVAIGGSPETYLAMRAEGQ